MPRVLWMQEQLIVFEVRCDVCGSKNPSRPTIGTCGTRTLYARTSLIRPPPAPKGADRAGARRMGYRQAASRVQEPAHTRECRIAGRNCGVATHMTPHKDSDTRPPRAGRVRRSRARQDLRGEEALEESELEDPMAYARLDRSRDVDGVGEADLALKRAEGPCGGVALVDRLEGRVELRHLAYEMHTVDVGAHREGAVVPGGVGLGRRKVGDALSTGRGARRGEQLEPTAIGAAALLARGALSALAHPVEVDERRHDKCAEQQEQTAAAAAKGAAHRTPRRPLVARRVPLQREQAEAAPHRQHPSYRCTHAHERVNGAILEPR
eukprot:scaffold7876_cov67-Phaeocystis_antarctica.AAC.5